MCTLNKNIWLSHVQVNELKGKSKTNETGIQKEVLFQRRII
jgi:hypothetical protein